MEPGIDFVFRDDLFDPKKEGTTVPVELMVDPYQGVVYRYTVVSFKMEEDNIPRLQFDWEIINAGKFSETTLRRDNYFVNTIGLILNALLLEASEEGEIDTDALGTDNTKEPNKE